MENTLAYFVPVLFTIVTSFIENAPDKKTKVWLLLKMARNYGTLNITNKKFLKVPNLPFHSGHF
jgi:hypothetical protein